MGGGSIILPGVSLAKKTIVAAGSVVTKSVETEGLVIGGNPAKKICTIDDYLKKNYKCAFNIYGLNEKEVRQLISSSQYKLIEKDIIG